MDWFLYDRGHYHEIVQRFVMITNVNNNIQYSDKFSKIIYLSDNTFKQSPNFFPAHA